MVANPGSDRVSPSKRTIRLAEARDLGYVRQVEVDASWEQDAVDQGKFKGVDTEASAQRRRGIIEAAVRRLEGG